jgi:Zn-finger nucleic acid-binding protein
MEDQKDRFGELMRLLERAREDIYFAAKDRELIEKLKARLAKVEKTPSETATLRCPKCKGELESHSFDEFLLERCKNCGGLWLDHGELEAILKKLSRGPLAFLIHRFLSPMKPKAGEFHKIGTRHKST